MHSLTCAIDIVYLTASTKILWMEGISFHGLCMLNFFKIKKEKPFTHLEYFQYTLLLCSLAVKPFFNSTYHQTVLPKTVRLCRRLPITVLLCLLIHAVRVVVHDITVRLQSVFCKPLTKNGSTVKVTSASSKSDGFSAELVRHPVI